MAQLIAGLYEIEKQIGAGGGGVVWLGRHIRLNKTVVLKADKRKLSTKTDALRREVDMLKNLSHTYIPQVYDFIQEDGMVYTVMDFIEGESLDKLLARKQTPTQSQIIEWACQLLEALCYLHGQPPHGILHGDIKPANIMLRPNGTICLIDYNIALALGEDGAVKVGFSRGYASPEHYGADYISANRPAAVELFTRTKTEVSRNLQEEETEVEEDVTEVECGSQAGGFRSVSRNSSTGKSGGILLDVRSDIYSLGATLYHLISGEKPSSDAWEVKPLGADVCSPAVWEILKKSMAPIPDNRYQTAEEMLLAFHRLHSRDKRVLVHKRKILGTAVALTGVFLAGGLCTFVGLKQMEQSREAMVLAEYSANALREGDVSQAVTLAMQAIPDGSSIFDAPVTAQARKALTDALGVYDLSDGFRASDTVEISGAPFDITISPEGTRFAAVYAYEVTVFDTDTYREIATFPTRMSALSDVVFVDESRIIYAGEEGVTAYDLDAKKVLWKGEEGTFLALSAEKNVVAAVNGTAESASIYRVLDGEKVAECSFEGAHINVPENDIFADPKNYVFELNADGSLLAVSFYNGGLRICDIANPEQSLIVYENSDYTSFTGGFCGKYFAFAADEPGGSSFKLIDTKEGAVVGEMDSQDKFFLQTDEKNIYLASAGVLVELQPDTLEQAELAYLTNAVINGFSVDEEYVLVTADDDTFSFYDRGAHLITQNSFGERSDFVLLKNGHALLANRDKPLLRLLQSENHEDAQMLVYDARYAHDEARISADGQTAMLFSYEGFRVYAMSGELVAEAALPDIGQIYDQQFHREEGTGTNPGKSWLEVIWYDGTVRCYSAEDGSLLSEEKKEAPDRSLREEFVTDQYRIEVPLHETPVVYSLKSGKKVAELEREDYLAYVTQVDEYILTEYVTTKGERYGLLLDEKLQTLAYLPNLCDVAGGELIFDYESGNLRRCRLYSLLELTALGESYMKNTAAGKENL